MSKYISELMSPQLMGVVYAFVGFIIALYVLSVVYVFIDARRRGASAYVAWGIIALIPFVGLIAYLVLRPHSYAADREEQELDMALRERQLAQYGTCPQCGAPIEKDFVVCPVCDTQVRNVCPSCHRPARCALEGLPVLPNSHSVTHPSPGRPQATGTPQAMRAPHPAPHDEACVENRPPLPLRCGGRLYTKATCL